MPFKHLCRIVCPFALSDRGESRHLGGEIEATDPGEQGEVSQHFFFHRSPLRQAFLLSILNTAAGFGFGFIVFSGSPIVHFRM